jgi:nicotinamidase-related amidase
MPAPFALAPGALLVVDMQNDFVRAGAPQEVPEARTIIPTVARLIAAFREAGRPVLYTRFIAGPQRTLMWAWSPECGPEQRSCWRGVVRTYSDGPERLEGPAVIPELGPLETDEVIDKYGYGGFHNTTLADALAARAVRQVAVTGTVTQICVEETVREGFHRGFEMVVVADGVASFDAGLHAGTLRNLAAKFARVEPADAVLQAIRAPTRA